MFTFVPSQILIQKLKFAAQSKRERDLASLRIERKTMSAHIQKFSVSSLRHERKQSANTNRQ